MESPLKEIYTTDEYFKSETESTLESLSSDSNIEDKIINITGQINIKEEKITIVINKDGKNNKIIEDINNELRILEELNYIYNKHIETNKNNHTYKNLEEKYKRENEILVKQLESNHELEIIKYKNRLKLIESNIRDEYYNKINILEYENKMNKEMKLKLEELNKIEIENNKERLQRIELNIKNEYVNKIKLLEDTLANIREKSAEMNKFELIYKEERIINLSKENEELKQEKNQLYLLTNKKSQTKGKEGEQEIIEYLKSKFEYSNAIVENVGRDQKFSSDIYLEYEKIKCVIEIKKHETAIQKNDIKKFEEVYIKKENYNCGIFISLESDYSAMSNRHDFNIMYIEDKPVIYLSNVSKNINKVIFGIKILKYLLENKNTSNFDLVFNLLKAQINNYSNLNKKLLDMNQILNELIKDTKNNKKEIEKLINPMTEENDNEESDTKGHFRKLENNLIQCIYCSQKPYDIKKTKSYIIKHLLEKHSITITSDEF